MSNQAVDVHRKYYRGNRSDITDWVKEKLNLKIGLHQVFMWAFLDNFIPGLTVVSHDHNAISSLDELLCKLCDHVACKVYQCNKCLSFYCEACLKILVETFRFIGRLPPLNGASPFRDRFHCMVCTNQVVAPRVMGINRRAKEVFESLKVRCQKYDCDFEGTYYNAMVHINNSGCYNKLIAENSKIEVKINMKVFHDFGRRKYPMEWPTNIEYSLSTDENTNFIKRFTEQLVIATENNYFMLNQPRPNMPSTGGAIRLCPIPQLQRNQNANLTQEEIDNLRKAASAEREAERKKKEDEQKEKERIWAIEGRDFADCIDFVPSSPVDWSDTGPPPDPATIKWPQSYPPGSPKTVEKRKRAFKEILELGRQRRAEEAKEKEAKAKASKENINKDKPKQASSTIVPEKTVFGEQEKSLGRRLLDHISLSSFGTKKVTEKPTESEAGVRSPRATSEPAKEVEPVEVVTSTESTTQLEKPSTSQESAQPRFTTIIEPCSPPRPSGSQEISVIDQILSEAEPIHWDSEEPQEDNDDEEEVEEDKEIKISKLDPNLIKRHEGEPQRKRSRLEVVEKARQEGLSKEQIKKRLQRNAKREKENQRRKQQRERKMQKIINSLSNVSQNCIKLGVHEERVNYAFKELSKQGKRVCGFDVEKVNIVTQFHGVRSLPVWIGIVDGAGNTRMNKIIRYPKHSIQDFNTIFHGLTWEHLKDAQSFSEVRDEAVDILLQYDIICVAGGLNDFVSLCISEEDWKKIRPRIRDVNQYYNLRLAVNESIGLRFSTFIFFQQIIQDGAHSPIVDASYTLFLYLLDHEKFEEEFNQVKNGPFTPNPFPNYIYPRNTQMATLLKEVMKIIKDWPAQLRMRANPKWKWSPSYDPAAIIDGDRILRAPYSLNINQLFAKWRK